MHSAIASLTGDAQDTSGTVGAVLACPRTPSVPGEPPEDVPPDNLDGCVPSAWSSLGSFGDQGWVRVRRLWSGPSSGDWAHFQSPEHLQALLQAATLAGFASDDPLMHTLHWVRYPVRDEYIASPVDANNYAVGQTYVPQAFADFGAHASRAIFLPELAQLPDVSYSVWDWAAGNEVCPIGGMDGQDTPGVPKAFSSAGSGQFDVNNCHDFGRLMGALNSSHFKFAAQEYWGYYHSLAKLRMKQCTVLDHALGPERQTDSGAPLPTLEQQGWFNNSDPVATYSTEAHECEVEAMVFEMAAQHFLQDNWSTGHMWARWGTQEFYDFSTTVGNTPGWADRYPNENLDARRVITGTMLGAASGTIHGTKAISAGLVATYIGGLGAGPNPNDITDDPLSGPLYGVAQDAGTLGHAPVSWSTGQEGPFNGVGDFFFAPPPVFGKASIMDPTSIPPQSYVEQQTRMLACSAASLRDAYQSGPQLHGKLPTTTQSINGKDIGSIKAEDLAGDYCWGNFATNASMLGSLGPFYLRNWSQPLDADWLQRFNQITAYGLRTQKLNSAVSYGAYPSGWLDELTSVLTDAWNTDTMKAELAFTIFTIDDPAGTEAAKLVAPGGKPLTMLGAAPGKGLSPGADPISPPVSYADRVSPREGIAQDYFVQHMFWRSHLQETCSDVAPVDIQNLRARCVQAAPTGGDPESCTACVEAAEPRVPACGNLVLQGDHYVGTLDASKCDALGVPGTALVSNWADPSQRWASTPSGYSSQVCISPQQVAIAYCTGTEGTDPYAPFAAQAIPHATGLPTATDGHDAYLFLETDQSSVPSACASGADAKDDQVTTWRGRIALSREEGDRLLPNPEEIVTAFDGAFAENETISGGTCSVGISLQSLAVDSSAYGVLPQQWDVENSSFSETGNVELGLRACGVTERLTEWNRACADVAGLVPGLGLGGPFPLTNAIQPRSDSSTVAQDLPPLPEAPDEQQCFVAEPRHFSLSCSGGAVCNSAGLCVQGATTPPIAKYMSEW
jgi:hypothetical protein